jgi:hypothetical protein
VQPAAKFRKKPVVIEAQTFDGTSDGAKAILPWMAGSGASYRPGVNRIFIPTLEGIMEASPGDWIIKGISGEFYPCKPHIFKQTYEPADGGISCATDSVPASNARSARIGSPSAS